MIEKSKSVYNLSPFLNTALIDNDGFYFQVFDFPERLAVGKNSFRIKANNSTLALGSPVYIDIRDFNNNPIYFEVLNKKTQDSSRIVNIHINKDLPEGNCSVIVGGIVKGTSDWNRGPNVLLYKSVPLTISQKTQSPIVFDTPPVVQITEVRTSYEKLSNSNSRRVNTYPTAGNRINVITPQVSEQFMNRSKILDETQEDFVSSVNDSKTVEKVFYTSLSGSGGGPRTRTKTFGVSSETRFLPKYTDLPVVFTDENFFSKSMEGGQIIINRIRPSKDIPGDALDKSSFSINSFSASIVRVVNSRLAEIDNPFYEVIKYRTTEGEEKEISIDSVYEHRNFTASYVDKPNLQTTKISESFAVFDLRKLEPASGYIDKIHVKYKPVGSFGDYKDSGEFRIYKQNLLSDRLNYLLTDSEGYIEKPIGKITNSSDLNSYWVPYTVGGGTIAISRDTKQVFDGISIVYNAPSGSDTSNYGVVSSYSRYYFEGIKDTEYNFEFQYFGEKKGIPGERVPQIEIYASGSSISSGIVKEKNSVSPISSPSLGTFISSLTIDKNSTGNVSFPFKCLEDGYLQFNLVVRSGNWILGNIAVTPNVQQGYTPNQARFNIPVDRFDTNSELSVLVEYYNPANKKSEIESKIYGVYFSGSYKPEFSGSVSYSGSIPIAKYDQTTPSTTWTFTHNLNQLYPVVTVYGNDSKVIIPQEIISQDSNTLIATFPVPLTGTIVAAGGNFVNISGSCCGWDEIPNRPPGVVSGSSQIDFKSIENVPVGILSSSFQIASDISGSSNLLSSSLSSRISPLEYSSVSTHYRGTYSGATSLKPKLIHRESLIGDYEVQKVYVYVSASGATFSKADFYFTTGSLLSPYDPRSNSDYQSSKEIGKVTLNTISTTYTSSVFTPSNWIIRNGVNGIINFFVSGSSGTVLTNNSFTTVGMVLKRI